MIRSLASDWWLFALRGVAAIVLGVLAFLDPGITLSALVLLFGAYLIVDGVTMLAALARGDATATRHAWSVGIIGVLGIVAGVLTFVWPETTALTLLFVVAFWAITTGVMEVAAAIAMRKEIEGEFWMGLSGVLSVAFGALLIINPGAGLVSLIWLVGIWAIAFGVSSFGVAYRLHGLNQYLERLPAAA